MKNFLFIFLLLPLVVKSQSAKDTTFPFPVIEMVDSIPGDFSFRNQWSYPEGVFKNEFGEVTCDGLCHPRTDNMKDKNGRILKDSLKAFYSLVDTTHLFSSMWCESSCSEFVTADYLIAKQITGDSVYCYSLNSVGTHCSLHFAIKGNKISSKVFLNSIVKGGDATYDCLGGTLRIERGLWKRGILKGDFYFTYVNPDNNSDVIYWKGRMYAIIQKAKK